MASGSNLRHGHTSSCGCRRVAAGKRNRIHGRTDTPEFKIWTGVLTRCENPRCEAYPRYGGRGIEVCERWQTFENFLADMGPRPSADHSIDRIENDGNYEPGNCRWATDAEQNQNTRSNRLLTYAGRTQPLSVWAREFGIRRETVRERLKAGWDVERALTVAPRG